MTTTDAAPQADAAWDEAQCIAALAQLERLQAKLDNLRLSIPRVIEPFYSPPSPAVFRAFQQGLVTSQNDIKRFRGDWTSQETQKVLEHARLSLNMNPDLSACIQVPSYGWVEKETRAKETTQQKDGVKTNEEARSALTRDDVSRIVQEFRTAYPKVHIVEKDDHRELLIQFVANGSKMRFRIVIQQEANGQQHKLIAECLGTTDPFPAITRCIESRPQEADLKYLLDMIAAYKTVDGTACTKCGKMLDSDMLIPVARRSEQIVGAGEKTETVWRAFHEDCLD